MLVFAVGSALAGSGRRDRRIHAADAADARARRSGPSSSSSSCVGGLGSLSGALIASMLIGILQTFAVAVDYSMLDLFRALGIAVTRATPLYDVLFDQGRDRRADRPLPAAGPDAHRAAPRFARQARRMSADLPRPCAPSGDSVAAPAASASPMSTAASSPCLRQRRRGLRAVGRTGQGLAGDRHRAARSCRTFPA